MVTSLTDTQQAGVDRAARKFQRNMQALVDKGDGITSVTMRAGDDEPITIASKRPADDDEPTMAVLPPFVLAAAVERICDELIDEHAGFTHLNQHRLTYLFETKVPANRGGCQTIGRAHVVNPLWHAIAGWDGVVVINGPWWATANDNQKMAICYHELSHYATNDETGALATVKHDLEVFVGEARHFGAWRTEIGELAEQLALFDDAH